MNDRQKISNRIGGGPQFNNFKKKPTPKIFEDDMHTNLVGLIRITTQIRRIILPAVIVGPDRHVWGRSMIKWGLCHLSKYRLCFDGYNLWFFSFLIYKGNKSNLRSIKSNPKHVQPKITYTSNNPSNNTKYEPRDSLSIDQINKNIRTSRELGGQQNVQVNPQLKKVATSKVTPGNIKLFDKQKNQPSGKSVNVQTINQLLGQKAFVKQMLKNNPEFLENVIEEVKEQIREEVKGRSNQMR